MVSPNYLQSQDLRYLDRKRHQEDQEKILRREKLLDEEIERRKEIRLENLRKDVRSKYNVKSVLERPSSDEGSIGEMIRRDYSSCKFVNHFENNNELAAKEVDEGSIGEMIDDVLKEIILGNCCDTASE